MENLFPRHDGPSQSFSEQFHPSDDMSRHKSAQRERYVSSPKRPSGFIQHERHPLNTSEYAHYYDGYDRHHQKQLTQIDEALQLHCGISAKQCFVAAITEDGCIVTSSSPAQLHEISRSQFLSEDEFHQVIRRVDTSNDTNLELNEPFSPGQQRDKTLPGNEYEIISRRQTSSAFEEWNAVCIRGLERARGYANEDVAINATIRTPLVIGDSGAVWQYYEEQFRNCQQVACKLIAKAWVKTVEPKKQSAHPYTGEEVPDWWPKHCDPAKSIIRHKEPDHLYKNERVYLLAHILRMAMEPRDKQHSDVQKMGLSVKKLQEAAFEALVAFFAENNANANKKLFLDEMFRVAKQEERYKDGEIDGTTTVFIIKKKAQASTTDTGVKAFRLGDECDPFMI